MFLLLHPSTYCRAVAAMLQRRLLHRVTNRVIPLTPYTRNFTCGVRTFDTAIIILIYTASPRLIL